MLRIVLQLTNIIVDMNATGTAPVQCYLKGEES